ncbi:MAG: PEP-CTERM sorting domain-containing protein [Microbacteriaceae bacterium]|nr:PEP-CTERM sorting domain-containing protein [Burkholderiaceae bacterium]
MHSNKLRSLGFGCDGIKTNRRLQNVTRLSQPVATLRRKPTTDPSLFRRFAMKLPQLAALALLAAATATSASAASFTIDFEKDWVYGTDVNGYYSGGAADDGSSGANLGVSFTGVTGLSNDDPAYPFYVGAPSMQGVAYAYTNALTNSAFMNVAAGVDGALSFSYASPLAAVGAIKAYSGLNGTGSLLGSFDLTGNSSVDYDNWTAVTFNFAGTARSFDLTGTANLAALDNISAVPEPTSIMMMLAGGIALLGLSRRRRQD